MLRQYSQLAMLHAWLQYRIEKNMSIPETNDETTRIMSSNTDGFKLPKRLYVCPFFYSNALTNILGNLRKGDVKYILVLTF